MLNGDFTFMILQPNLTFWIIWIIFITLVLVVFENGMEMEWIVIMTNL